MTLSRNAIGNLVNRYKAVLNTCNLCNAFGTLAVAVMLVLGGAGTAMANSGVRWWSTNGEDWFSIFSSRSSPRAYLAGDAGHIDSNATRGNVVISNRTRAFAIYGGHSKKGNAIGNSVTIAAPVNGGVYGGYSEYGEATGNSVTIAAPVYGVVYGGFSAHNPKTRYNLVTLLDGANVPLGVYGGSSLVPRHSGGNTLTVAGAAYAGVVGNFQYYNFGIPAKLKSGDTLLRVGRIDFGSDVEVTSVKVYGTRDKGETFALVQSSSGMIGNLQLGSEGIVANTITRIPGHSETVDGIFEYGLYFDADMKNLYARITDVLDLKGDEFVYELVGALAEMFKDAYDSDEIMPSYADDPSKPAGVRFLSKAINENYGKASKEAAKAVESVARTAAVAAVPQMALGANLAGVGAIGQRTTIGQPTGSLQSTTLNAASGLNSGDDIAGLSAGGGYDKSGFAMWIMPLWQSNNNFGVKAGDFEMDSHASIGGIAIGADYTIEQAVRLGLTFNMGGGYAEGSGDMATTRNNMNFWGIGAYAGWMFDNFGLTADVNYTSTHNSIKQEVDPSFKMQDMESEVMASTISAGLRAEYKFNTDALDIIPHVGVRYIHLTTYGYDVESAGETVLEADAVSQNIWTFPIGVQFAKSFNLDNGWYVRPSLDLNVTPAAGDINVKREVRFTGVTASAKPETQTMDWITYGGQAGLEFGNDNLKLGLNYSLQAGAHTTNHGVFGSLRYEF